MAREVHSFSVTIPAGTPKDTPLLSPLTMPARTVVGITVIVPPGPRGNVGFALAAAGRAIIPYEPSTFFVTDDEVIDWPLEEQISSGAWQLLAYNTGGFNHTLEVRFLTDLPGAVEPAAPPLIAASVIAPAAPTLPSSPPPASPVDLPPPPLLPFGPSLG